MDNTRKKMVQAAKEYAKSLKTNEVGNVVQAIAEYLDGGEVSELTTPEFALFCMYLFFYDEFVSGGE